MQSKNQIRNKPELSANSNSKLQPDCRVQCEEGRNCSEAQIASWVDQLSQGNTNIHGWNEKGKNSNSTEE